MKSKCSSCIRKYDYKTAIPCRYCKWNTEDYFGKNESKMVNDNYIHIEDDKNSEVPF
jgi:hypothetical protein